MIKKKRIKSKGKQRVIPFTLLASFPIIVTVTLVVLERHCKCIDISADGWTGYIGAVLAYIVTVSLGYVAYWQTKEAYNVSERMLKNEEERNFPFVSCKCGEIAKSTIEVPEKETPSMTYSVTYEQVPIYTITLRNFESNKTGTAERRTIPVYVRNISSTVITQVMMTKISFTYPATDNGDLTTDNYDINTDFKEVFPSLLLPQDDFIIRINVETNVDAIKKGIFILPTKFTISFMVRTLKHESSQQIILDFSTGRIIDIRYSFEQEDTQP